MITGRQLFTWAMVFMSDKPKIVLLYQCICFSLLRFFFFAQAELFFLPPTNSSFRIDRRMWERLKSFSFLFAHSNKKGKQFQEFQDRHFENREKSIWFFVAPNPKCWLINRSRGKDFISVPIAILDEVNCLTILLLQFTHLQCGYFVRL